MGNGRGVNTTTSQVEKGGATSFERGYTSGSEPGKCRDARAERREIVKVTGVKEQKGKSVKAERLR
jgi:hypothetical protein